MLGHSRSHGDIIRRQRELPAHLDTHHVICRQDRPRALPAGEEQDKGSCRPRLAATPTHTIQS